MKKLLVAAFVLIAGYPSEPAAQAGSERLAYDHCFNSYWYGDYTIQCTIEVGDLGSTSVVLAYGIGPTWSPDGSRIAFTGSSRTDLFDPVDIVVVNVQDRTLANLTNDSASDASPAWSPDGSRIAFASNRGGAFELYVMNTDGSEITKLSANVGFAGNPAWSPDGGRIAFDCEVDAGNRDICAMDADGADPVRLTTDPAWDSGAVFSPNGLAIAFGTTRYGSAEIAIMNADGSGVSHVGAGTVGIQPAWSPDGARIAFVVPFGGACEADGRICPDSIDVMNADGTGRSAIGSGNHTAWASSLRPIASFVSQGCNGLTCTFDGSGSSAGSGTITSYAWDFGDGTTGSGPTVSHAYLTTGSYSVGLTVTDDGGFTGTQSTVVDVVDNAWPVASFQSACDGLTCSFDGSGSSDPDGIITSYAWHFGDGESGGSAPGPTLTHTYADAGTFTVTLMVTDDRGATGRQSTDVQVAASQLEMHLGDLDGASSAEPRTWTALVTIAVHDETHGPVAGATVGGSWSSGAIGSCTTSASGQCAISLSAIPKKSGSVTFTVGNVAHGTRIYQSADNHDPDADSGGTAITVRKP